MTSTKEATDNHPETLLCYNPALVVKKALDDGKILNKLEKFALELGDLVKAAKCSITKPRIEGVRVESSKIQAGKIANKYEQTEKFYSLIKKESSVETSSVDSAQAGSLDLDHESEDDETYELAPENDAPQNMNDCDGSLTSDAESDPPNIFWINGVSLAISSPQEEKHLSLKKKHNHPETDNSLMEESSVDKNLISRPNLASSQAGRPNFDCGSERDETDENAPETAALENNNDCDEQLANDTGTPSHKKFSIDISRMEKGARTALDFGNRVIYGSIQNCAKHRSDPSTWTWEILFDNGERHLWDSAEMVMGVELYDGIKLNDPGPNEKLKQSKMGGTKSKIFHPTGKSRKTVKVKLSSLDVGVAFDVPLIAICRQNVKITGSALTPPDSQSTHQSQVYTTLYKNGNYFSLFLKQPRKYIRTFTSRSKTLQAGKLFEEYMNNRGYSFENAKLETIKEMKNYEEEISKEKNSPSTVISQNHKPNTVQVDKVTPEEPVRNVDEQLIISRKKRKLGNSPEISPKKDLLIDVSKLKKGDRTAYDFGSDVYFGSIRKCAKHQSDPSTWKWEILFDDGERYLWDYEEMLEGAALYEKIKTKEMNDPLRNRKLKALKQSHEREKAAVLRKIPDDVKALFFQIGFALARNKIYRPVLILGPYDVSSGEVRECWFNKFHKVSVNDVSQVPLVVYWFGVKRSRKFSILNRKDIILLDEGLEMDICRRHHGPDAWDEMREALCKPLSERPPFQKLPEEYEYVVGPRADRLLVEIEAYQRQYDRLNGA